MPYVDVAMRGYTSNDDFGNSDDMNQISILFIYYNITHPRKYDLVDVSRFLTRFFNARLVMIAWSVQLQY